MGIIDVEFHNICMFREEFVKAMSLCGNLLYLFMVTGSCEKTCAQT